MTVFRLGCLRILAATLLGSIPAVAQTAAQTAAPQGQAATPAGQPAPQAAPAKPQPPAAQPPKNNPFETIPEATEPAPPPAAPAGQPPAAQPAKPGVEAARPFEDVVESIEFRGVRRVPQDTLRA